MLIAVIKQIKTSMFMLIILSAITGLLYPMVVTIVAQLFFPWQANGSLIKQDDAVVGSVLIGQEFKKDQYFWGRPSATKPTPYNPMASGGSNFGPSNVEYLKLVDTRIAHIHSTNSEAKLQVPIDLVTSSASGLDPHISMHAAYYQAPRVAKARRINLQNIKDLIAQQSQHDYVNVLQLNLALDQLAQKGSLQ